MGRAARWGMLAAALALTTSSLAFGDDAAATREGQARFEEGIARVKAENFEAARAAFAQAYAVLRKPQILWNLALTEQKTGRLVDALTHFKQFARETESPDDRANAKRHIDDLAGQTGHVDVEAATGADVAVDGTTIGVAPLAEPVDVTAGRHHVEARTRQGASKAADVDVAVGQVAHVSLVAASEGGSSLPRATLAPEPNAPVLPTSAEGATALEAEHSEAHSRNASARIVTVAAVGGAAVVAGAFGVYFGLRSDADANSAATLRAANTSCLGSTSPGCQQLRDTVDGQHSEAVLSKAFWITGGVLAVGAVVTWLVWPERSSSRLASVRVVPAIGPGGSGVAVVGFF
jgi:hypothetical protein